MQLLVREQEELQPLGQRQRHHSLWQLLQGSSWHCASIDPMRFSKHRQKHCASCQRFAPQQQ